MTLHHLKLFESPKIKYLGLILDNKLDLKARVAEVSKKLSSVVGLLYKIRSFCPQPVLRSLYFSLFNSHLSYGLVVWGNSNRLYIDKIKFLQKRALKSIVFANNDDNTEFNRILFDLKILNIDPQIQFQLSSFMWDYDHNTLPPSLKSYFKRANLVHSYSTQAASKGRLHYTKVNTVKYGIKSFKYQGLKVLNDLKKTSIYQNSRTKSKFLKDLKSDLLSKYTT